MPRWSIQLTPRWRRIVVQGVLVLVFAGAVGLAMVVTRHVTMRMRVELAEAQSVGRLMVRLPAKWVEAEKGPVEKGDSIEVEEVIEGPAGEGKTPVGGRGSAAGVTGAGRRLRVTRQRSEGFVSPLEHLYRSGRIKADVLRALAEGREGYARQNVTISGWPGQMVSYASSIRPGVMHKDVIACAVLRSGQALVVHLQGVGPVDASDQAVVKQICENVSVSMIGAPPDSGGAVNLPDGIRADSPAGYIIVPADDPNQLQRQLLFDGQAGAGWAAIDLAACVYFPDDSEETLLAMLHARDPDWRSGPVKRLGARTLMVERVDHAGGALAQSLAGGGLAGQLFPARAYLVGHEDGRALLVVMRGGLRDGRLFDGAWAALGGSVRFEGKKDLTGLLANGAEAAGAIVDWPTSGKSTWKVWDQAENAGEEEWLISKWALDEAADGVAANENKLVKASGVRRARQIGAYSGETNFEQHWSLAPDLSKYEAEMFIEIRRERGQLPKKTWQQRVVQERGRLTVISPQGAPGGTSMQTPAQFVPGAVLPLVLRDLAEKPSLIKTESFMGTHTAAGPGLLTLFITRLTDAPLRQDERGQTMDCISVSVNGTGMVSRWYYGRDEEGNAVLRFIDFAGAIKAVRGE